MADTYRIILTDYELANLRATLDAGADSHSPLCAMNTGDWLKAIRAKLPQAASEPNITVAHLMRDAREWLGRH